MTVKDKSILQLVLTDTHNNLIVKFSFLEKPAGFFNPIQSDFLGNYYKYKFKVTAK
jgi:hypothetical protein